jgi:Zn-dependent protease with chaperone function
MRLTQSTGPIRTNLSSAGLRWSVTLQALVGAALLLALLAGAALLAFFAIGVMGAAIWTVHPLWAGLRFALVIPALATCAIILRWFWSPIPAAKGIPIEPADAPDFYRLLERFCVRFGVEQRFEVRVTGEMNASIVNRPRTITLLVGLPLLLSVTPKQCTAILAHEFGHLRIQRIGPGAWTSHLRAWWHRVLAKIAVDQSLLGRIVSAALKQVDDHYLADSLRLSHEDEFEADAWAARTIGAEPLAGALFSIATKERFLQDDFWRKVHAQADHYRQPTMLPFQQMASALKAGYDAAEALAAYDEFPAANCDESLTHPSIEARCAKLAVDPRRQRKDAAMAAEIYLQAALPRLALELDLEWWAEHGSDWRARHREVQRARRRIARLEEAQRELALEERLELAALVENYCVERDPLDLYLAVLATGTPCAHAMLAAGRLMLERKDPQGTQHLLQTMAEESEVGLAAAAHLLGFASAYSIEWLHDRAVHRANELMDLAQAVRVEGERDGNGQKWEAHGLDPMTKRKLAKALSRNPFIRRCYLVRRISALAPSWIAYVLVVRTDVDDPCLARQLGETAESVLPEQRPVRVLLVARDSDWERRATLIEPSQIHLSRRQPRNQTR